MQVVGTLESVAVNEYGRLTDDRGRRLGLEILKRKLERELFVAGITTILRAVVCARV